MENLPANLQQQVLDFIKKLTTSVYRGIPRKKLLRFAAAIPPDDLEKMSQAIEDCEQVDLNGRYLLDTNEVIALFAGETSVLSLIEDANEVFIPNIVIGELYYRAKRSKRVEENIEKENHLDSSEGTRTGFASVNGIKIYFETTGEGQPLLLLHAGVADSRMWDRQFEAFSTTHLVIRCDLRGFGQSGKSSGSFAHYEDIAALLKYLNVEPVRVVGSSFGGYVAIDFALACPEMVTGLVLAAPALGGYEFESAEMLEFFAAEEEALARGDLAAATELNLKMWVEGFNRQPEAVSDEIRERVREMQFNIFSQPEIADVIEKELAPPAIDQLHKIMVPTLVIVGDKDVAEFQTISTLIAQKVENARHEVISGAAHLPNMEKPEEFNRLVLDFLS